MPPVIDISGNRYGRLTVLSREGTNLKGHAAWKCLCECGNEAVVASINLRSGDTKSCGCLTKLPKGKAARNQILTTYKYSSVMRRLDWSLSDLDFDRLTSSDCHYCGDSPSTVRHLRKQNGPFVYNGIDRVDNDLGYTLANSVPCCTLCNRAKGTLTVQEFETWINRLAAMYGARNAVD